MPVQLAAGVEGQKLEWVRSPQQVRSQQTLERLLDAAESLLIQKGFDNTTVADIARAAGSSVGAFYARFGDKENLLRCVFERFAREAEATVDAALKTERWNGVPFYIVLREAMRFMVAVFRDRHNLIAMFAIRSARDEHTYAFGQRVGEVIVERTAALIRDRGERIGHSDPTRAVRFCVWTVLAALESRALHGAGDERWFSDEQVAYELTTMCLSYLQMERD